MIVGYEYWRKRSIHKQKKGYRPGTLANLSSMFKKYIEFCIKFDIQYLNLCSETICVYMEYLLDSFTSYKSVMNYLGAINTLHRHAGIELKSTKSFDVVLMSRALAITMRHQPKRAPPITLQMLRRMCDICDKKGALGLVFKLTLLLGFFGLLRVSSLCPDSYKEYDHTRYLTRQDVQFVPKGLLIHIKWSKTMQAAGQSKLIPVPAI